MSKDAKQEELICIHCGEDIRKKGEMPVSVVLLGKSEQPKGPACSSCYGGRKFQELSSRPRRPEAIGSF